MASIALTCVNAILITNTASAFSFVFSSFFFQGNFYCIQWSRIRVMQSVSYKQKTTSLCNPSEGKNLTLNRATLTHAGHCRNKNRQSIMGCEQISCPVLLVSLCMSYLSGCDSLCIHRNKGMSINLAKLWRMWTRSIRQTTLALLETKIFGKTF